MSGPLYWNLDSPCILGSPRWVAGNGQGSSTRGFFVYQSQHASAPCSWMSNASRTGFPTA